MKNVKKNVKVEDIDMTAEEFDEMLWNNEHFKGKTANMKKMNDYKKLKEALLYVFNECELPALYEDKPKPTQRNASIYLDIKLVKMFMYGAMDKLKEAINIADSFTVTRFDEQEIVRLSFSIHGVWED